MAVFIELLKMVRAERGEVLRPLKEKQLEESRRPFDNNISGAGPDFDGNCSSIRRTGHCLA